MSTEWAVVAADDQFTLDARNSGVMTFTVSNPGRAPDTVVFDILPGDGTQRSWFSVEEPQREVAPQEAVAFQVKLVVPAGTPARRYDMTGLAYSANTAPEESSRTSGRVSYEVATIEKPKKKPWPFIIAAVVLVLVVAGVVTYLLTRSDTKEEAVPPPPPTPVAAKLGDFTGDRKADITLTGVPGWGTIPMAISQGDGHFHVKNEGLADFPQLAATPGAQVAQGDFNGDGKTDMALAGAPGWGGVPIAFSKGDGTFSLTNRTSTDVPGWAAAPGARLVAGDFNGDGRDDLLIVGGPGWASLPVAFSNGDGTFRTTNAPIANVNGWAATPGTKVVTGDVDGDGKADLIITGGPGWSSVPVAFSKGDGTFNVTNLPAGDVAIWAATPNVKVAAGDVDGDGKADLIITGGLGWHSVPVAFSAGNGTFRASNNDVPNIPIWSTTPGVRVIAGDFNGDGKDDFALTGGIGWGTIPLALSTGSGSFDVKNEVVVNFPIWAQTGQVKIL